MADAPGMGLDDRRGAREAGRRGAMIAIVAAPLDRAAAMAVRHRGATAVATSEETAVAPDVATVAATVVAHRLGRQPVDGMVVRGAATLDRTVGQPAQAPAPMPVPVDPGAMTGDVAPSARMARDLATSRRDRRSTLSAA